jgi:2C-methyl-D-erythritol 2,4-cyclodiphosphate synthase
MRDSIAALLGVDREAVNVKASSGNLDGPEGAGRSISAMVVASIVATVEAPR